MAISRLPLPQPDLGPSIISRNRPPQTKLLIRSCPQRAQGHQHRMLPFFPKMRDLDTSNSSFTARVKTCQKPRDCCRCTVEHCNAFCADTGSSKMQRNHNDVIAHQSILEKNVADHACQNGPTIYFDGSCALCSTEISHYALRVSGDKLGFVDVSSNDARLDDDLTSQNAMRQFHER